MFWFIFKFNSRRSSLRNSVLTAYIFVLCLLFQLLFPIYSTAALNVPVTGVEISHPEIALEVNTTHALTAQVLPLTASNRNVVWSSSASSIVSVDQKGLVKALDKGTAIITATTADGGFQAASRISVVINRVTGVMIEPSPTSISLGDELTLSAVVLPLNADNKKVNWHSSNNALATVNSNGIINALGVGVATITATTEEGKLTDTRTFTINPVSVTGVTISPAIASVSVNRTLQLTANFSPANATNKNVIWTSSNAAIATVDANGLVTGRGAGTATINVQSVDGNYTASRIVSVSLVNVTGLSIAPLSATVLLGSTLRLSTVITPDNASDTHVSWRTSNPSAATVDHTGLVTARAAGEAVISATTRDGNHIASSVVTVGTRVTGVTLTPSTLRFRLTDPPQQLVATVIPADAQNRNIIWSSSNPLVATVNTTGLVTRTGTSGTATITVRTADGGHTASASITIITNPVTGVTVTPATPTTINAGLTNQLTAAVAPVNATDRGVAWTSSNEAIATVSTTGLVRGMGAGTAIITVTTLDGGFTASVNITVTVVPVTGVTVAPATATINVGETQQLTATVLPANASNRNVTWSSSDPTVATVSALGLVSGLRAGTTVITVRTVDGGRTAASNISVTFVNITSISLLPANAALRTGMTLQLNAAFMPANASNRALLWTSSNTNVVTVNDHGLVAGLRPGTATITVTTVDGGRTATSNITVTGEGPPLTNTLTQSIVAGRPTHINLEGRGELLIPTNAVTGELPFVTAWAMPDNEATPIMERAQAQGITVLSGATMLTLSGGKFSAPVSLTLNFDPARVPTGRIPAVFVFNDRTNRWVYIGGTRVDSAITAQVSRFSKFAVFASNPLPVMNDIAQHWARAPITTLAGMNVLGGYPDGTFRPNANVTRAEFASMLTRALHLKARPQSAERFTDTAKVEWAVSAIGAAVHAGLIGGYPDDSFGAQRGITRDEIAVILDRVIQRNLVRVNMTNTIIRFSDEIPAWAKSGVLSASRAGLIGGFQDNTFRPTQTATRAEVAAMLFRLIAQ